MRTAPPRSSFCLSAFGCWLDFAGRNSYPQGWLRYFIGVDNPPFIKARREMTEEQQIHFVRATYYGNTSGISPI